MGLVGIFFVCEIESKLVVGVMLVVFGGIGWVIVYVVNK